MKVIILLSGGIDSTVTFYEALEKYEVMMTVSFDYGSKHNHKEIPFAKKHSEEAGIKHEVVDLGFVNKLFNSSLLQSGENIPEGYYEEESMKSTVVPFRNGIMLSIVAGIAESINANGIVIGAHSGDHAIYPDCREDFMQSMSGAIEKGTYEEVKLLRPFIDKRKEDIVARGHELGVDFSQTWSCYKGGNVHCGLCGTCIERKEAFKISGVEDPTIYEN